MATTLSPTGRPRASQIPEVLAGVRLLQELSANLAVGVMPRAVLAELKTVYGVDAQDLLEAARSGDAVEQRSLRDDVLRHIATQVGSYDALNMLAAQGHPGAMREGDLRGMLDVLDLLPAAKTDAGQAIRAAYGDAVRGKLAAQFVQDALPWQYRQMQSEERVVRASGDPLNAADAVEQAETERVEFGADDFNAAALSAARLHSVREVAGEIYRQAIADRVQQLAQQKPGLLTPELIAEARRASAADTYAGGLTQKAAIGMMHAPVAQSEMEQRAAAGRLVARREAGRPPRATAREEVTTGLAW